MRVLIISDNLSLSKRLSEELDKKGCQLDIAENVKDGEYYVGIRNYDLFLSSWHFQKGSGSEVILMIREKFTKAPIIIISNSIEHEIDAFKNGADDYIGEPFVPAVLSARIHARLKLWGKSQIEIQDLKILPDEEKVIFKGQEVEVKGKPFEVLTHLALQKGQVVSKDQLLNAIWTEPELVTPNVIEVAINQIRQKMDKPLGICTIETVRRRGYRFCYPKN